MNRISQTRRIVDIHNGTSDKAMDILEQLVEELTSQELPKPKSIKNKTLLQ